MNAQDYDHIVLLAHGSTDPAWKEPFERLEQTIQAQYGVQKTTLAFMELTEPSLETVLQSFSSSVKKVGVLPLFFSVGRHLRHDVPKQIAELNLSHLHIDLLAPIGEDEQLQNTIVDIVSKQLGK